MHGGYDILIFTFSDFIKNGKKSILVSVLKNAGQLDDLGKQPKTLKSQCLVWFLKTQ